MSNPFKKQKAKREKLKAMVNFSGASGSGKTFSALLFAKGLMDAEMPEATEDEKWAAITVIDTEHGRSLIYTEAEKHGYQFGEFGYIPFDKPHTPERYVQAIQAAKDGETKVIIIDSMSHAWKEMLQMQQDAGGRYQDWKIIRPKEAKVWEEIFEQNQYHVLTTMRAKQSYELEKNDMDKLEVRKMGLQAVQNNELEFEYILSFMLNEKHLARATKDNTPFFEELGEFKITPEHGRLISDWLDKGVDVQAERKRKQEDLINQLRVLTEENDEVTKVISQLEMKAKDTPFTDWDLKLLEAAWSRYIEPLLIAQA